jgi:LL-diaminopimelate aminotransferase
MEIKAAKRMQTLPPYAFKVIFDRVAELKSMGIVPIDFGVGDPSTPTPKLVREACKDAIEERKGAGYPTYIGAPEFRRAVAAWSRRRFGLDLDSDTEITSTIGAKEGIFNFPKAFIDPGDVVLIPSPGYPPYSRGTLFADGTPWFYPLDDKNGFLPDLDSIPDEVAEKAKLMWVCYPNAPTGVCPGLDFYEKLLVWTRARDIILASDEPYSEFYFGESPPPTALQAGREGVVVFNSLSKRSAMTGYRVGWLAGDPQIISIFRKMKTNVDSGTPTFIQDAAIAALADEQHVDQMREEYRVKRDVMVRCFDAAGLANCSPSGTIYIWQRVPEGMDSMAFASLLMKPETAIVATPGSLISETVAGGYNPGENYVRFSLTPTLEEVETAAERIARLNL